MKDLDDRKLQSIIKFEVRKFLVPDYNPPPPIVRPRFYSESSISSSGSDSLSKVKVITILGKQEFRDALSKFTDSVIEMLDSEAIKTQDLEKEVPMLDELANMHFEEDSEMEVEEEEKS